MILGRIVGIIIRMLMNLCRDYRLQIDVFLSGHVCSSRCSFPARSDGWSAKLRHDGQGFVHSPLLKVWQMQGKRNMWAYWTRSLLGQVFSLRITYEVRGPRITAASHAWANVGTVDGTRKYCPARNFIVDQRCIFLQLYWSLFDKLRGHIISIYTNKIWSQKKYVNVC